VLPKQDGDVMREGSPDVRSIDGKRQCLNVPIALPETKISGDTIVQLIRIPASGLMGNVHHV
jgi:hypothetical protein